jgi:hypothetical protein
MSQDSGSTQISQRSFSKQKDDWQLSKACDMARTRKKSWFDSGILMVDGKQSGISGEASCREIILRCG